MAGKQEGEPLSFKAMETMQPGDKDKAAEGENRGLRVSSGATGVNLFLQIIVNLHTDGSVKIHNSNKICVTTIFTQMLSGRQKFISGAKRGMKPRTAP